MPAQGKILTLVKYFIVLVSISFLTTLFVQTIHYQLMEKFFIFGIIFFILGYALADLMTGTVHWFCDSFCVTSGWLNPLLDYINFFPKLESFIRFFSHDSRT